MTQLEYEAADFSYGAAQDNAGLPARVAIFGERALVRNEIAQDLTGAGFRAVDGGKTSDLLDGPVTYLGDVVMVDCPIVDAATIAALARLDVRAKRSGAKIIISTSFDALDDVFAALYISDPQILVQPSRAERIVAVGRVLAEISDPRVREMTDEDRLSLLHLSRQVETIAREIDRLSGHRHTDDGQASSKVSEFGQGFRGKEANPLLNAARLPLPEPRLVRRVIAARQARGKFFDGDLFADPAWDMLLDLTAAHAEHTRVSVTSLCIAAGVPGTTALRWIKQLVDSDVFVRVADPTDKRRAFIALSEGSLRAMARYFAEVETPLAKAA